ncbi:hypothetical protein ACA910_021484 [Epithemia clementina (nom. ined.)]
MFACCSFGFLGISFQIPTVLAKEAGQDDDDNNNDCSYDDNGSINSDSAKEVSSISCNLMQPIRADGTNMSSPLSSSVGETENKSVDSLSS